MQLRPTFMERTCGTAAITALPAAVPTSTAHRTALLVGLLCGGLLAAPLAWQLLNPAAPPAPQATKTRQSTSQDSVHAQATPSPRSSAVTEVSNSGTINWTLGRITVQPASIGRLSHADALLQTLRQIQVDADSRLADWMRQYPQLATRIDRLSRQHSTPASPLAFNGRNGLSTLLLAYKLHSNSPAAANNPQTTADADAITLIIDARSLPLQPALYPRLLGPQGQTRYALSQADPNRVASHGLSIYTPSLDSAHAQVPAGQTVQIIKASQLAPGTHTDLLLTKDTIPGHIRPPIVIVTDALPSQPPKDSER